MSHDSIKAAEGKLDIKLNKIQQLPQWAVDDLLEYFEDSSDPEDEINSLTNFEILDKYLECNGVIGCTSEILRIVKSIYTKEDLDKIIGL